MRAILLGLAVASLFFTATADAGRHGEAGKGLSDQAAAELRDAGVDKYVGEFTPVATSEAGNGWDEHLFDPQYGAAGPAGPVCIAGTPYSVYTKAQNPKKLLIFLQGGGACWQDFYNCNVLAGAQDPSRPLDPAQEPPGIFGDFLDTGSDVIVNPIGDWSVVYMPYCDGSVFSGDNDVIDPSFPFGPVRFHRGLRNVTAGVDLAKSLFPDARRILIAGSSAGGVGAASFAPFLTRMVYGNTQKLSVFNDAGPIAINLDDADAIEARAEDWKFGEFYPASCTECDAEGQGTALVKWRLDNDSTIREAFYSTDQDLTNRFFMNLLFQPLVYRQLVVGEHAEINAAHPARYKRFIRSGDTSHTALQRPSFYTFEANGIALHNWLEDFIQPGRRAYREKNRGKGPMRDSWVDVVEDFQPAPQ